MRINQLTSGMVLRNDVRDRSGRVLLRRGAKLTDNTVRVLKTWGVSEVEIRDDSEDGAQATIQDNKMVDSQAIQEAEQQALNLFRHTDLNNLVTKELFNLCMTRIAHEKSGSSQ